MLEHSRKCCLVSFNNCSLVIHSSISHWSLRTIDVDCDQIRNQSHESGLTETVKSWLMSFSLNHEKDK